MPFVFASFCLCWFKPLCVCKYITSYYTAVWSRYCLFELFFWRCLVFNFFFRSLRHQYWYQHGMKSNTVTHQTVCTHCLCSTQELHGLNCCVTDTLRHHVPTHPLNFLVRSYLCWKHLALFYFLLPFQSFLVRELVDIPLPLFSFPVVVMPAVATVYAAFAKIKFLARFVYARKKHFLKTSKFPSSKATCQCKHTVF